jgi:hypothetical protein
MKYFLFFLILKAGFCFSQTAEDSLRYINSDATYYANTISTHPLGVFISRINSNFQIKSAKEVSLAFNMSSGNVWLPYVKAYFPLLEVDKNAMSKVIWHEREGNYDALNTPSRTSELQADGSIRLYKVMLSIPVFNNHELKISTRLFSLDKGRIPFSLLTSDQFIEWFHSNIAGGEDPFARKVYGYNHAKIIYTDQNGKTFQVQKGDIVFTGMDLSWYYYPDFYSLAKKNLYTSIGLQICINASSINPSLDIGLNPSIIKKISINKKNEIKIGLSSGVLCQKFIKGAEGIQLSNKKFLLSAEFLLEYLVHLKGKSYMSFATTFYVQDSYNKKIDYQYIVLTGERFSSHWNYAISQLYRPLTANSLILNFIKGAYAYSVYVREDLLVDNSPDLQTGIGIKMNF